MGNGRPRVAAKKFYGRTFARLGNEGERIFYGWILQARCELSTLSRFPCHDACSRGRQRRECIIPWCLPNIWPDRLSKLPLFCVANNARNNVLGMNFCCAKREIRLELLYGISKMNVILRVWKSLNCKVYWIIEYAILGFMNFGD